jgi:hypothetical protein
MTGLPQAATEYLALRRSLGYRLVVPGRLIRDFADHLERQDVAHVTIDAAVSWATAPGASPYWHWYRLSAVRLAIDAQLVPAPPESLEDAGPAPAGRRQQPGRADRLAGRHDRLDLIVVGGPDPACDDHVVDIASLQSLHGHRDDGLLRAQSAKRPVPGDQVLEVVAGEPGATRARPGQRPGEARLLIHWSCPKGVVGGCRAT